jgi:DNA polymerase
MSKHMRVDLETYSDLDLTKVGVYKYASSPNFRILLFAYCYDDKPIKIVDLANGEELPHAVYHDLVDSSVIKHAFNATFERVCLSKFLEWRLPADQWHCTMVHSATLGLPLSLQQVGEVLQVQDQKMADGKKLIRKFSKPNAKGERNLPQDYPDEWQKFKDYCVRDVEAECQIADKLSAFPVSETLKKEYVLDQQINDRGVLVDMQLVEQAIKCDEILREKYSAEMEKVTGLENPNSVKQLREWLSANGWSMESLGKKEVEQALETAPEPYRTVLKLRQKLSKTSVKKYTAMKLAVCPDGTIKGMFQFHGTRTARWSGRLVQLQNLKQNHMENIAEVREQVRNGDFDNIEVDTLSELTRTALVARENRKFIVADFSAIEARVLAWLAGEDWKLDVFRGDGKIYEATGARMFGVPIETVTKELRQKSKQSELSCGFGGGIGALKAMGALEQGIAEDDLQGLVDNWREANPRICRFWYNLEDTAVRAVKTRQITETHGVQFEVSKNILFMQLPSGRRVAYCFPRMQENQFGRMALTFKGVGVNKKWVRIFTFSGRLAENLVQSTARDLLSHSMQNLTDHGYKIVMHCHDEVIIDAELSDTVEDVCRIMAEPPAWARPKPRRGL